MGVNVTWPCFVREASHRVHNGRALQGHRLTGFRMECFKGHRLMWFTIDVFYRSRMS